MNDDPKKPAGETQDGSAGDASSVDSASPQHVGGGPSSGEVAADLPGDGGLRALYAQLPDIEPRAALDEAILAASREVMREAGVRGETGAALRGAEDGSAAGENRRRARDRIAASSPDRSSRRSARERVTRVLRWSLPVAAAASVMFAVLHERGDLVPQAEFAASLSLRDEQASKLESEYAKRISRPSPAHTAPAEQMERDDSASPRFAPPAPPPAVESKLEAAPVSPMADAVRKAAPASPEARSAAREAYDSSAAVRDGRARNDAPSATTDGRGIPAPPPAGSAAAPIPAPSAAESDELATSDSPARASELRSAPATAKPTPEGSSSIASAVGALAAKEAAPGLSITETDKPWPLGLEFAMSTEDACAKLRPLSSRGCVRRDEVAVIEFDRPWRLTSGDHEGRWIVAVTMIASDGRITQLHLTQREERKE